MKNVDEFGYLTYKKQNEINGIIDKIIQDIPNDMDNRLEYLVIRQYTLQRLEFKLDQMYAKSIKDYNKHNDESESVKSPKNDPDRTVEAPRLTPSKESYDLGRDKYDGLEN